ncbi:hypothetical protein ACJX0J_012580, partial [Zea mays]
MPLQVENHHVILFILVNNQANRYLELIQQVNKHFSYLSLGTTFLITLDFAFI